MQDRYAADIGDYVKFALLRRLSQGRHLGIAWYLHPNTRDGDHIHYLSNAEHWRSLDSSLFDKLRDISLRNRSVAELERSGLVNAKFSGARLDCAQIAFHDRDKWRRNWFAAVKRDLEGCDLVFADPDNGLVDDQARRRTRSVFCKQLPLAEARALSEGRVAVIYHHNTRRKGGHTEEVKWWIDQFGCSAIAVRANAYRCRTFFILNPDDEIRGRALSFCATWAAHKVSFVG